MYNFIVKLFTEDDYNSLIEGASRDLKMKRPKF